MSNIIPFGGDGPAELPAHLAALFGDACNIDLRQSTNMLSYKGKVWRTVVDGEEHELKRKDPETGDELPVQVINLVVLDLNKNRSRAYYDGDFVDGENKRPRCSSIDGVKPDASIANPIAATCASCPNAVKGSKQTPDGKATTLCAPNKRIAVVPSGKMIGKHPVLLLKMAQTSVWDGQNKANEAQNWFAWDQYLDWLRARGAKHTAAVETRVKFDPSKAYPKLLFSASRWLNPDEAAAAKQVLIDKADEISKILNGGGDDGVAGSPGIPAEGVSGTASQAGDTEAQADALAEQAAKAAAAQATAKAQADAKAAADKKAAAAAAKKAKAEAAAKAAAEAEAAAKAAAAAAAAAEEDDGGAWAGGDGDTAVATAPADTKVTTGATETATTAVESSTPSALKSLLDGWDDNE